MSRNVCITAVEGHTGFLIAELLLTNDLFKKEIGSVVGLAIDPNAPHCKELAGKGATIMPHKPGRVREVVSTLQKTKADTLCLIPPAHGSKADVTYELIEASKRAGIRNVCFLSAAGCDLAERSTQPRLREFIDLEAEFLKTKGDPNTSPLYSPVVIRWVSSISCFMLMRLTIFTARGSMLKIFCSTRLKLRKRACCRFPSAIIINFLLLL